MRTLEKFIRKLALPIMLHADGDGGGGGGDSGAGAPAAASAGQGGGVQQSPPSSSNTPPPATDLRTFINEKGELSKGWAKALGAPEDFEGKYTSLASVLGAHGNLTRMLGRDKIPLPNENSTQEEWDAFYARTGRPEKPEDYGIKRPDGLDESLWDDGRTTGFQSIAHKLGLSPKQAQGLVAWELEYVGGQVKSMAEKSEAAKKAAGDALRKEWGVDYDTKLTAAKTAALQIGGEAMLADATLANHPAFIRAMAKVGEMIGEGNGSGLAGARDAKGQFGGTAQDELNRILNDKNDPYWHSGHPQHASRMEHVQGLYRKMHPDKK